MGKKRNSLADSFVWTVRNLDIIAVAFIVASVMVAICAPLSSDTQDCTIWGWLSWSLACSLFLNRYSADLKSVKVYLLSLFDIIFVIYVSAFTLFGVKVLPELLGLSLCLVMLIFTAIHGCIILPEYKNCKLAGTIKKAVLVLLGAAVLGAIMAFNVPQWVIILMLNAATAVSIIIFRKKRNDAQPL